MTDPYALTPAELAAALARIRVIRAWCEGVEAAAQAALIAQLEIPGWRLGFNKPHKKWLDTMAVVELCSAQKLNPNEYMPPELLPPGKLLDLLKRNKLDEQPFKPLITRNEPKLVVTEIDNTYYDDVNAVDLAQYLAKQQQGNRATTAPAQPKKRSKRGAPVKTP